VAFDRIDDHEERVPELLITQFRGKPRAEALAKALTVQTQPIEDATHQVAVGRFLSNAEGVQLDGIGEIVGRSRAGLEDDVYRGVLRAQVRVLLSSGQAEELLTIARLIIDSEAVRWDERYPAAGAMMFSDPLPVDPSLVLAMLQAAKSAGVRLVMEFPPDDDTAAEAFTYSDAADWPVTSEIHGFGDSANGVGGRYFDART
jgi:hypothetical protein